jgi:cytochrome c oxidase subunit II
MEKTTKIGIGLFLFIVISGYIFVSSTKSSSGDSVNEKIREIVIDAKRFEFSQPVIEISKDERVRIKVNNIDTMHGIFIPELGVNGRDMVEFTADKVGEFSFACATMCGAGHRDMTGKIVVT